MQRPTFIARQSGRPHGPVGALIARIMAKETVTENARALQLLELQQTDTLLEVGSGHGATLKSAAKQITQGIIAGIDFSNVMVNLAKRKNRRRIKSGTAEVRLASSDKIPYADATFTKALGVHTIYFWSKPSDHFDEVFRVLAPGGKFVLVFRPGEDPGFAETFPQTVYHIRKIPEVLQELAAAGFETRVHEDHGPRGHLVFAEAIKP